MFVLSVLTLSTTLELAVADISGVGFKNPYYQGLMYRGSRALEHNQTGRFGSYVEAVWSQAVALDTKGRIWIADTAHHQVLLVEDSTRYVPWPAYYIEYAGSRGESGHFDGSRRQARFNHPRGISLSMAAGQLIIYVADTDNHCIRRLDVSSGRTATIVGHPQNPGLTDGPGMESRFRFPMSMGIDATGQHLFVLDNVRRIRHVDLTSATPVVWTLTGGACRAESRWTVAVSVVMRRVGCHSGWHALDAGDPDVAVYTSYYICVGHVASCGPRHHPALADHSSVHQQPRPAGATLDFHAAAHASARI